MSKNKPIKLSADELGILTQGTYQVWNCIAADLDDVESLNNSSAIATCLDSGCMESYAPEAFALIRKILDCREHTFEQVIRLIAKNLKIA